MSVIGLIQAFNEEGRIGAAITSLRAGGCDRVVVLDGAWENPDGTPFGGGESWYSTDNTKDETLAAGGEFRSHQMPIGGDAEKCDTLMRYCRASLGDHLVKLDADEILVGTLDADTWPHGHGSIIHRDLVPNDLDIGGVWPRGDYGPEKPLLRWFRWSDDVRCEAPGVYFDAAGRIHAYLVGAMAERAAGRHDDLFAQAHRVLRDHEHQLAPVEASLLPIVPGVEIHHVAEPSAERVEAKRRYYAEAAA